MPGLLERDQQRRQADANDGNDTDALAQTAAARDDVLRNMAAWVLRIAAVDGGRRMDRRAVTLDLFGVHRWLQLQAPAVQGQWCACTCASACV
jgi:hypothetical protein